MKKLLLRLLMVLVAALTVSCVSPLGRYQYTQEINSYAPIREIPIWVDKNFVNADRVSIAAAIEQWNYALNGYIKLNVVDTEFDMEVSKIKQQEHEHGWLIMKIYSDNSFIPKPNPKDKNIIVSFVNIIGGNHIYLIRDRESNEQVPGLMLHEIGHLLGARHNGKDLMSAVYTATDYACIDYDTLNEVANYEKLPIMRLNYCTHEP